PLRFPCGCRLICKPSALTNCLLKVLRRFSDPDVACWLWRKWAHVQTLYHQLLPGDRRLESARDHLQLPDGGIVALDWVVGPWTSLKHRRATNSVTSPPVLLVIPNAFGKITRNVQDFCLQALEQGFYPVIFNRRGQNGCPLTTLKLQQFGDPADLAEAVAYIRYRHPSSALFAMSEGLESGLLLSYLGECGSSSYLTAAVCISPVLRCQEWFEAGLPWLYRWALVIQQKMSLSRSSGENPAEAPATEVTAGAHRKTGKHQENSEEDSKEERKLTLEGAQLGMEEKRLAHELKLKELDIKAHQVELSKLCQHLVDSKLTDHMKTAEEVDLWVSTRVSKKASGGTTKWFSREMVSFPIWLPEEEFP
ncbi:protein ABHD15-like, partial [Lissotriton helveticus]